MDSLLQDLRYGMRTLRKAPAFTLTAIATLALGIGGTTAMFSVINAVMLRPLPFQQADRLILLQASLRSQRGTGTGETSLADYFDWRDQGQSFESLAAYTDASADLTGDGRAENVVSCEVSANFFPLLGVQPSLGRNFLKEEDRRGGRPVVILSDELWRRRYHADAGIVGRSVQVSGTSRTVAGVMPAGFRFPLDGEPAMLWLPIEQDEFAQMWIRDGRLVRAIGRLKEGVSLQQAQAELDTIAQRLEMKYPDSNKNWGVGLEPLYDQLVGSAREGLLILFGAVGAVLLIACVNVSNLMLVRGATRQPEIALRAALGASNRRIARQLIVESLVLAGLGGTAGLSLSLWLTEGVQRWIPVNIPRLEQAGMDMRVLGFSAIATLLSAVMFGLLPAARGSRLGIYDVLKSEGRAAAGARNRRAQRILVVAEISLTCVLLIAGGLLLKSLARLLAVDPGFKPEHLVTVPIDLPEARYPARAAQREFFERVLERARKLPEVESASVIFPLPLKSPVAFPFQLEQRPGERLGAYFRTVSAEYFRTMGIALLAGRWFTDYDRSDSAQVAIINDSFARRFWPGGGAIGSRITIIDRNHSDEAVTRDIVGVVADVRHAGLDQPSHAEMYVPYLQHSSSWMTLVVRTRPVAGDIARKIAEQVNAVDPQVPAGEARGMEQLLEGSYAPRRFQSAVLWGFAGVALLLTVVGVFGVTLSSVIERVREIGVRMALGARAADIFGLVIGEGLIMTALGAAIGIPLALVASRSLKSFLFEVQPGDPGIYAGVVFLLVISMLAATYLPARRALRIEPIEALHHE